MTQQTRDDLIRAIRQSIARVESSAHSQPNTRELQRVLAYLWMASDELEQLRDVLAQPPESEPHSTRVH